MEMRLGWAGGADAYENGRVGRPGSVPYPAIGRGYASIGLT